MWHPCRSDVLCVALLVGTAAAAFVPSGPLTPVVFVPGKGGNQLEAKLDKLNTVNDCAKRSGWFRIWLDLWSVLVGEECIAENLLLHYNETTRKSSNYPGVTTRVPGWGTTKTMEYLDPSWTAWLLGNMGAYAVHLVEGLLKWGYQREKTIVGAPYDFRYAPHSQDDYYGRVRALIENTYIANEDTRIVLIAHSMGGLFMHRFLRQQTDAWKNKYIEAFVTLNTPWSGAVVVAHIYSSGMNWGLRAIDPLVLRTMHRTHETASLLFPTGDAWGADDVIVETSERNYSMSNLDEYFMDINFTRGLEFLENVRDAKENLQHPGVDTYCLYGSGIPTPEMLVYGEGEFPDMQPETKMGDGDGTVNLRSLRYCRRWHDGHNSKTVFYSEELPNTGHHRILDHKRILDVMQMIFERRLHK
ncbi:hypothetical protein NP493_293g01023 [Ridgeia piscesae]|uniref:Lecithin:cholesterol acyltransferase n=1 Tax=Ridgeia piscesae TaxID=27915 RepID=A0AAD9NWP7_RIDPI|nr:hypothetical protein NP493_293g01023 [Ridgeia piscesae]